MRLAARRIGRVPRRARESHPEAQGDAGRSGARGQPAHQPGRVGGEKEVARRGEIDARHVWRIETHAVDPPHQAARQAVEQLYLLDDVAHQDARGVQLAARVVLALEHRDPRAAASQRRRAGQPREARSDHDAILLHAGWPLPCPHCAAGAAWQTLRFHADGARSRGPRRRRAAAS